MSNQPRYERINVNDIENGVPATPIPNQHSEPIYYNEQPSVAASVAPSQQPQQQSYIPQAIPIAQPIHPQQPPQFAYVPQQYVAVVPPIPTEAELEERIRTRNVEFSSFQFIKEGWILLKPNLCVFFLGLLTWIGVTLIFLLITHPIIMSAFPRHCVRYDSEHCVESRSWVFRRSILGTFFWSLFTVLIGIPFVSSMYYAVFEAMRKNAHVSYYHFFHSFKRPYYKSLLGLGTVLTLLNIVLGLLILPGIWFSIATMFVLPLHKEHPHLSIRKAMRLSIRIVHRYFCHILGFVILLMLLQVVGFFLFMVGLCITIPLAHTATCYAYHHLIGVNGVAILLPRSVQPVVPNQELLI